MVRAGPHCLHDFPSRRWTLCLLRSARAREASWHAAGCLAGTTKKGWGKGAAGADAAVRISARWRVFCAVDRPAQKGRTHTMLLFQQDC